MSLFNAITEKGWLRALLVVVAERIDSKARVLLHLHNPTHTSKPFALIAFIQAWNKCSTEPQARIKIWQPNQ